LTCDGVVDANLTLLVALARNKGWKCEGFPDRLEDKLLSLESIR
jgi:hypothetical protein